MAFEPQAEHVEHNGSIRILRRRGRENVRHLAPRHQTDQFTGGGIGDGKRTRGAAPVFDDRDAVADLPDLFETVGDVHHGNVLGSQFVHHPEEVFDLFGVEHSAGLVHDDEPDVTRQRPRHTDDLFARRRELPDLESRWDIAVTEPCHQVAGHSVRFGDVQHSSGGMLVPQKDVLRDGEPVDHVELLVHRRDSQVEGGLGVRDGDGFAEPSDLALVGLMNAGERFDQGRFSGAVLAEDAVDFARPHIEINTTQCLDTSEGLGDSAHIE